MNIKRIYVAGPMTGIKKFNFPAFHEAADKLRAAGHVVFDPAENEEQIFGEGFNRSEHGDLNDIPQFKYREALAKDLEYICEQATAIAMLPGWETSKGANAELAVAKAIGLEVIYL